MTRYEPREIDGRWAVYDTVEDRVTGWFGKGDSERAGAASHAHQMNDAVGRDDEPEEPMSLHAAMARHDVVGEREPRRGGPVARELEPW